MSQMSDQRTFRIFSAMSGSLPDADRGCAYMGTRPGRLDYRACACRKLKLAKFDPHFLRLSSLFLRSNSLFREKHSLFQL